jgi:hypothetical protein
VDAPIKQSERAEARLRILAGAPARLTDTYRQWCLDGAVAIERLSKIVNEHCQPPSTALALAYQDNARLMRQVEAVLDDAKADRQAAKDIGREAERLRAALERARELIRRAVTEGYSRHEFNCFLGADENAL